MRAAMEDAVATEREEEERVARSLHMPASWKGVNDGDEKYGKKQFMKEGKRGSHGGRSAFLLSKQDDPKGRSASLLQVTHYHRS